MRILYGVQGTGNGHLTRARAMAKAFAKHSVTVDWVFSGRGKSDFFDMQAFGDFRCYQGMTLQISQGKVNIPKTVLTSNLLQLKRDTQSLPLSDYDLVISDFEPVTAWAARAAGKPCLGISHQSSFLYPIPKRASNFITEQFMRLFAPCSQAVGVHWHHFGQPLLPPIIEPSTHPVTQVAGKILVYLPFRDLDDIVTLLTPVTGCDFYIYHKAADNSTSGNLHLRRFSREGFQEDLHSAAGVICSAGFELPSEALQLGKKLLAEPVARQMEQQSNALALEQLGYASTSRKITSNEIQHWLDEPARLPIHYPDVAAALAAWITAGRQEKLEEMSTRLWSQVPGVGSLPPAHSEQVKCEVLPGTC